MRNTNKNAFFLFYFHNGVPWTARSKVIKFPETPKKMRSFFVPLTSSKALRHDNAKKIKIYSYLFALFIT